jgi:hypothetical protein
MVESELVFLVVAWLASYQDDNVACVTLSGMGIILRAMKKIQRLASAC